ncbi:MAG: hypothetical protein JWL70_2616 [Acidimicrobiia bacterium]|nr:hypothetical protein [Acidimicrobiia bacterium]
MMNPFPPPQKRPASLARRTFLPVFGGLGALLAIFGMLWLVSLWISRHADQVDTKLGDNVFHISVAGTANRIAQDGLPVGYPDPLQLGRDIWVNHVGPDLTTGWYVFNVQPTGEGNKCKVAWEGDAKQFRDPCTKAVFGPDGYLPGGGGPLRHYAVTVTGNDLAINLRAEADPPETTSTRPTTSSTAAPTTAPPPSSPSATP